MLSNELHASIARKLQEKQFYGVNLTNTQLVCQNDRIKLLFFVTGIDIKYAVVVPFK